MICLLNIFKKFSFFFFWVLLFYFRSICIIAINYHSSESLPKNLFSSVQFYFCGFLPAKNSVP